jgi:hypothetical protein
MKKPICGNCAFYNEKGCVGVNPNNGACACYQERKD